MTAPHTSASAFFSHKSVLIVLAVLYAIGGGVAAWHVIERSEASTHAIDQILSLYNMKNEGEQSLTRFTKEHPILGTLFASPLRKELNLPSHENSTSVIFSDVPHLKKTVRQESFYTAWWSWFLLSFSFIYAVSIVALERSLTDRPVLFALTTVSVLFFFIGILAPGMVIWTAPVIPMESGKLDFVVQHEVRGIAAIIWDLLKSGHWIIGGFLLLFSIITPMTKAALTFFVTASSNTKLNYRIGQFLHTIGKWSMADVFVAAVILALYALKFQQATKSIPCIGLYYFIGYCLLSLTTTELLVHSAAAEGETKRQARRKLGNVVIGGLAACALCFAAASSLYTYDQYTLNLKEKVKASGSPEKLDNADLVLPVHKKE